MKRLLLFLITLLFLTACGRATISPDLIRENIIEKAVSFHPGTAGSSLQQAAAAADILQFATEQKLQKTDCKPAFKAAWNSTDQETQEYFRENFEGLSRLITSSFDDYDSVKDLFEDAGAAERMENSIAKDNGVKDWQSLCYAVEYVLNRS